MEMMDDEVNTGMVSMWFISVSENDIHASKQVHHLEASGYSRVILVTHLGKCYGDEFCITPIPPSQLWKVKYKPTLSDFSFVYYLF